MKYVTPSAVRFLFFIAFIELVIFGAGSFLRTSDSPEMKAIYNIYAALMFGDAIAMLIYSIYIEKRIAAIYWSAVILLVLNIGLTVFDQLGLIDFLFSFLNAILLAALYILRKEFLPQ